MLEDGRPRPVFGMNRGTVGFLMNEWRLDRLAERIAGAKAIRVDPLEMRATCLDGSTHVHAAIALKSHWCVVHCRASVLRCGFDLGDFQPAKVLWL